MNNEKEVIAITRRWVETWVIGLNLCPFAAQPVRRDIVRYRVTEATDEPGLIREFLDELNTLNASSPDDVSTTLFIIPDALADFYDFNDFRELAEDLIADAGAEEIYQLASFHPDYQFADTKADAASNFTNRAPYPVLQLLREDEVEAAISAHPDPESIPEDNIRLMESLGLQEIVKRLKSI